MRFRPAMGPAVLEKLAFVAAIPVLYALDRVSGRWLGFAAVDAVWLVLFIIAYVRTGGAARRFSDRKIPV